MTVVEANILRGIPSRVDTNATLGLIKNNKVGPQHLQAIKTLTLFNDEKISDWLDISVKTFRSYKKPESVIKARIKEHAVMTLSLIKHGIAVFGSKEGFSSWLEKANFFFDHKAPIEFMDTHSGLKFIDDRLTGIEYGDNA
ncbi:MAG TPA: MbcA/ParS/Xre antitoxin family protein [Mucilaginibacter sp.]|nr:MbcA/ParS/Xre antitoxin family protein [Mucilaginibacter sp.]